MIYHLITSHATPKTPGFVRGAICRVFAGPGLSFTNIDNFLRCISCYHTIVVAFELLRSKSKGGKGDCGTEVQRPHNIKPLTAWLTFGLDNRHQWLTSRRFCFVLPLGGPLVAKRRLCLPFGGSCLISPSAWKRGRRRRILG